MKIWKLFLALSLMIILNQSWAREDRIMSIQHLTNASSYFNVTVTDSGLLNGMYPGWCADWDTLIEDNKPYKVAMYSSLDPSLPAGTVDFPEYLDEANWLVNQHPVGQVSPGGFGVYTSGDMQLAIWSLIDDNFSTSTVGPFSQQRVDELVAMAKANGSGFVPNCKQVVLMILKPCGQSVQTTVVEIPKYRFQKCIVPPPEVCE